MMSLEFTLTVYCKYFPLIVGSWFLWIVAFAEVNVSSAAEYNVSLEAEYWSYWLLRFKCDYWFLYVNLHLCDILLKYSNCLVKIVEVLNMYDTAAWDLVTVALPIGCRFENICILTLFWWLTGYCSMSLWLFLLEKGIRLE